jgi:hypothetical protein
MKDKNSDNSKGFPPIVSVDSSPKAIDVPRLDRPRLFGEFL